MNWLDGEQVHTSPLGTFCVSVLSAEQDALTAMEALKARAASRDDAAGDKTTMTEATDTETTYAGITTTNVSGHSGKSGMGTKKKNAKPKLSAKEKKERSVRGCTVKYGEMVLRITFWGGLGRN